MSYTNGLDKPSDYFNTVLYTGDSTDNRTVTGVGFQPDFLWIKDRSNAYSHALFNSVRGSSKMLATQGTDAEQTNPSSGGLTSFDTDGFTTDAGGGANPYRNTNQSGDNYAAWNWLADNTSGSSNTDGSITSTVSANTTSGFSIVSYTGNGIAGATIGHGLGVEPACMILKNTTDGTGYWYMYHKSLGNNTELYPNATDAAPASTAAWNTTSPTSSVFSVGAHGQVNDSGDSIIAYCFADTGNKFFKAGSYVGNGSTDGTFIHTGMKPSFLMVKASSATSAWYIYDNKRDGFNPDNNQLYPDRTNAEDTTDQVDLLSNGFKWKGITGDPNSSARTYIYMAFAENPFVTSTGIPCTAR